jgi:Putative peptidoglycan binding domain
MRRIVAALGIIAAVVAIPLVISSPAYALPTCYRTVNVFVTWGESGPVPVPSAGSTAASTSCLMGQGAQSSAVTRLQSTLNKCYGEHLTTDGIFGGLTKAALQRAQWDEGITGDGVYGPITRDHLLWWTGGYWGSGTPICGTVDQPVKVG